jgi:hypothetical protein
VTEGFLACESLSLISIHPPTIKEKELQFYLKSFCLVKHTNVSFLNLGCKNEAWEESMAVKPFDQATLSHSDNGTEP